MMKIILVTRSVTRKKKFIVMLRKHITSINRSVNIITEDNTTVDIKKILLYIHKEPEN